MKEKKTGTIKYRYLTAVLFLLVVFICFVLNMKETAQNYLSGETKGIRAAAADAESVDSIVYPFVNLNGGFQGLMQRDYLYDADPDNDTIRKSSGYIISRPSGYDEEDVKTSAQKLKESSDRLAAMDIPLIYIQAPSKMSNSPDEAMPGISNYTYGKNAVFREAATELGIDYVDSNTWLTGSDADFYRTDHHWTTDACFDVAAGICDYLDEHYGIKAAEGSLDRDSYEFRTHKRAFLGAEGRRTGIWYTGLDDFTEILPAFETDFAITVSDKDGKITERSGSFEEAVMDMTKDVEHYSFEDSAYYEYWGGDYGRVHVVNKKAPDAPKVLVFKDSYGIPVTAFLANAFSEMDIIDTRYYSDDKSIGEVIAEEQPDAVLYIYGTGYLNKKKMFTIK